MKATQQFQARPTRRGWTLLLGLCLAALTVPAAETNAPAAAAPAPMTPEQLFAGGTNAFNNWIEFSTGGFFGSGNRANFEQQHQAPFGPFGGIAGSHFTTNLDKTTTLTLDARAMAELDDYKLRLDVTREKIGYLRLNYREFRTWSDGDGGFFPATDMNYPLSKDAFGLDRGSFSLEAGLTPEKGINAIFKYTHTFRDGQEGSTIWGDTTQNGVMVRGLSPSLNVIHEEADSFQLDLTDHIKSTDLGLGLRFQTGKTDDTLKITEFPNEPIQQKVTDHQGTSYDGFDFHTFSETWIKTNLLVSFGFSYSHLGNTFFGSRIYGSEFDVGYSPNAQNGFGYYNLGGMSRMNEYVMDLNLLYKPAPNFTIIPSVRVQKDFSVEDSSGLETLGASLPAPFGGHGDMDDLDVRGRLDLAYRGFTNWVLHGRVDLTEVEGNLDQYGGLVPIGGIGVPTVSSGIDDRSFIEKYTAGVRWYPSRRLTLDVGGYYKADDYHYNNSMEYVANNSPFGYPGFLEMQRFATCDGNARATWRVLPNVSLITRYEYQWSTIHTAPDPLADLPSVESSTMQTHILAQDATWTPWSRLSLQTGFNYVLSDTFTPASDVTQAILDSRNNYWTVNFNSTLVVDNKTDLNLCYVYYQAADYANNSLAGVPYGAGGQEHSVTATLTRRISERIRVSLKYGYFRYFDQATGGNAEYGVNLVYATLRYRF